MNVNVNCYVQLLSNQLTQGETDLDKEQRGLYSQVLHSVTQLQSQCFNKHCYEFCSYTFTFTCFSIWSFENHFRGSMVESIAHACFSLDLQPV